MSYCDVGMVRRALVPTLDLPTAEQVPTTATRTAADFTNDQLQDAINEASATIDGYLGRVYNTPVPSVVQPIATATLATPLNQGSTYTTLAITPSLVSVGNNATIILIGINPVNGLTITTTFQTTAPVAVNDQVIQVASTLMTQTFLNGTSIQQPGTSATPPHPIDYWCRNIAAYNATLVYRGSVDFADIDPIARRYKDTLYQLQQVAAGKMTLQGLQENTGVQAATGAGAAINPYEGTLFTVDEFSLNAPNFDPVYGALPRPFYAYPR